MRFSQIFRLLAWCDRASASLRRQRRIVISFCRVSTGGEGVDGFGEMVGVWSDMLGVRSFDLE